MALALEHSEYWNVWHVSCIEIDLLSNAIQEATPELKTMMTQNE